MKIAIVNYQGSSKAATYGLCEFFEMANQASLDLSVDAKFEVEILDSLSDMEAGPAYTVVVLPPSHTGQYYLSPAPELINWLVSQHTRGSILASACAGTFILAHTQLLTNKSCTTHWGLADLFKARFPQLDIKPESILINEGSIITAGGMMSWMDLGLELVSQLTSPAVMRLIGKMLVVDTGAREQRFYQQFTPNFQHGDEAILRVQHYMSNHYSEKITNQQLSKMSCLTERTLQRHFRRATGLNINQYMQYLRVQKACDLLESTPLTFDVISYRVGYHDVSAFRKIFNRVVGLTPKAFRIRFCS